VESHPEILGIENTTGPTNTTMSGIVRIAVRARKIVRKMKEKFA
jgi:hypothetical protein